jgi:hypothetical protein
MDSSIADLAPGDSALIRAKARSGPEAAYGFSAAERPGYRAAVAFAGLS